MASQKAIGVILATLSRIEALLLTVKGSDPGFLGPSWNTRQHPVTRLLSPSLQSLSTLEEIILDVYGSNPWTLWYLILNCTRLRRVVLKGHVAFEVKLGFMQWENNHLGWAGLEHQRQPELQLLPRATVGKVQDLFLYRAHMVKWDLLPKIYPDLERLVTVFAGTGWRDAFWSSTWNRGEPIRLPEASGQVIAQYKGSLRSLTVTDFLSQSYWTAKERRQANDSPFTHVAPIPPLLSPDLPQVPLGELTTDCVWLFGRDDPSISYQISSLVPSSLVSLHLIYCWAVSVGEEGVGIYCLAGTVVDQMPSGPRGRLKRVDYYPAFLSGLTPLEFLDKVFATLHDSCADQHTRLKHITLSSPIFGEKGRWSRIAARPVDMAEVQAWQARIGDTFTNVGVRFSFTTMRELEKSIKSSWAPI